MPSLYENYRAAAPAQVTKRKPAPASQGYSRFTMTGGPTPPLPPAPQPPAQQDSGSGGPEWWDLGAHIGNVVSDVTDWTSDRIDQAKSMPGIAGGVAAAAFLPLELQAKVAKATIGVLGWVGDEVISRPISFLAQAGTIDNPLYRDGLALDDFGQMWEAATTISPGQAIAFNTGQYSRMQQRAQMGMSPLANTMTPAEQVGSDFAPMLNVGFNPYDQGIQDVLKHNAAWNLGTGAIDAGVSFYAGPKGANAAWTATRRAAGLTKSIEGAKDLRRLHQEFRLHDEGQWTPAGAALDDLVDATDIGAIRVNSLVAGSNRESALASMVASTKDRSLIEALVRADKGDMASAVWLMQRAPDTMWTLTGMTEKFAAQIAATGTVEMSPAARKAADAAFDSAIDRDDFYRTARNTFFTTSREGPDAGLLSGFTRNSDQMPLGTTGLPGVGRIGDAAAKVGAKGSKARMEVLRGGTPDPNARWVSRTLGVRGGGPVTRLLQWSGGRKPTLMVTTSGTRPGDSLIEMRSYLDNMWWTRGNRKFTIDRDGQSIEVDGVAYRTEVEKRINDAVAKDDPSALAIAVREIEEEALSSVKHKYGLDDAKWNAIVNGWKMERDRTLTQVRDDGFFYNEQGDRIMLDPLTQRQLTDNLILIDTNRIARHVAREKGVTPGGRRAAKNVGYGAEVTYENIQRAWRTATLFKPGYTVKNSIVEPWVSSLLAHGTLMSPDGALATAHNAATNAMRRATSVSLRVADNTYGRVAPGGIYRTRKKVADLEARAVQQREIVSNLEREIKAIEDGHRSPAWVARYGSDVERELAAARIDLDAVYADLDGMSPGWRAEGRDMTFGELADEVKALDEALALPPAEAAASLRAQAKALDDDAARRAEIAYGEKMDRVEQERDHLAEAVLFGGDAEVGFAPGARIIRTRVSGQGEIVSVPHDVTLAAHIDRTASAIDERMASISDLRARYGDSKADEIADLEREIEWFDRQLDIAVEYRRDPLAPGAREALADALFEPMPRFARRPPLYAPGAAEDSARLHAIADAVERMHADPLHPSVVGYAGEAEGGLGPTRTVVGMVRTDALEGMPGNAVDAARVTALADDIRVNGMREPIVVEVDPRGKRMVVGEGNHRLAAAREAGIEYVPVRVVRSHIPDNIETISGEPPISVKRPTGEYEFGEHVIVKGDKGWDVYGKAEWDERAAAPEVTVPEEPAHIVSAPEPTTLFEPEDIRWSKDRDSGEYGYGDYRLARVPDPDRADKQAWGVFGPGETEPSGVFPTLRAAKKDAEAAHAVRQAEAERINDEFTTSSGSTYSQQADGSWVRSSAEGEETFESALFLTDDDAQEWLAAAERGLDRGAGGKVYGLRFYDHDLDKDMFRKLRRRKAYQGRDGHDKAFREAGGTIRRYQIKDIADTPQPGRRPALKGAEGAHVGSAVDATFVAPRSVQEMLRRTVAAMEEPRPIRNAPQVAREEVPTTDELLSLFEPSYVTDTPPLTPIATHKTLKAAKEALHPVVTRELYAGRAAREFDMESPFESGRWPESMHPSYLFGDALPPAAPSSMYVRASERLAEAKTKVESLREAWDSPGVPGASVEARDAAQDALAGILNELGVTAGRYAKQRLYRERLKERALSGERALVYQITDTGVTRLGGLRRGEAKAHTRQWQANQAAIAEGRFDDIVDLPDDIYVTEGLFAPDQAFGSAMREQFGASTTARLTVDPSNLGRAASTRLQRTGAPVKIQPDDPNYFSELEYVVNRHIRQDLIGQLFLNGETVERVREVLMTTPGGQRYMRQMGWIEKEGRIVQERKVRAAEEPTEPTLDIGDVETGLPEGAESMPDELFGIVDSYLPTAAVLSDEAIASYRKMGYALPDGANIRDLARVKEVTAAELQSVMSTMDNLSPVVSGEWQHIASNALKGFVDESLDKMWQLLAAIPEERVGRFPGGQRYFDQHLQDDIDLFREQGVSITPDQINGLRQGAAAKALKDVERTYYNIRRYSNPVYALRYLMGFPGAYFNSFYRMARLTLRKPGNAIALTNAFKAGATLGEGSPWIVVDKDGNQITDRDQFQDASAVVFNVPEPLKGLAGQDAIQADLKTWDFFTQPASFSWTVSVPVTSIMASKPDLNQILIDALGEDSSTYRALFPYGPISKNKYTAGPVVLDTALPGYMKDVAVLMSKEDDVDYMASVNEFIQYFGAEWARRGYPKDTTPESIYAQAKDAAAAHWRARASIKFGLAGGFRMSPTQHHVSDDGKDALIRDQWRKYQDKYPNDYKRAREEFTKRFGDWTVWYTYSGSDNRVSMRPTAENYRTMQDYPELVEKLASIDRDNPFVVGLVGAGTKGAFDTAVYNWMANTDVPGTNDPMREKMTGAEFTDSVLASRSWDEYTANKAQRDAVLAKYGYTSILSSGAEKIREGWNTWLAKFEADPKNSAWLKEKQKRDFSRTATMIDGMKTVLANDRFMADKGGSSFWKATKAYMDERDQALQAFASAETSRERSHIKESWDSYVLKTFSPLDPEFARMYDRYLDNYDLAPGD